jgi:hypothetical protein
MDGALNPGWTTIRRHVRLRAAPVLAALTSLVLMPVNVFLALVIANRDPQGYEQILDEYHRPMVLRHTSGFFVNTVFAMYLGTLLAMEARTVPGGRRFPAMVGTFAWAAVGGVVLAAVSAGVAFLAGGPKRRSTVENGVVYSVGVFDSDGSWQFIAWWIAAFPAAAVLGAGIGVLVSVARGNPASPRPTP